MGTYLCEQDAGSKMHEQEERFAYEEKPLCERMRTQIE
jgi:hypothetical protein